MICFDLVLEISDEIIVLIAFLNVVHNDASKSRNSFSQR